MCIRDRVCAHPELIKPELSRIPLISGFFFALLMLPIMAFIPTIDGPFFDKNRKELKAGLRSLTDTFKLRFKILFSLIKSESIFSKLTEVAMAAIPMKKKMIIRPSATEAPRRDAKKLLKKFISVDFNNKDRVCEIVLRNLAIGLR